jgi:hypothetical protein
MTPCEIQKFKLTHHRFVGRVARTRSTAGAGFTRLIMANPVERSGHIILSQRFDLRLRQSPLFVTTCCAGLSCFLRISSTRNKSVSSARR